MQRSNPILLTTARRYTTRYLQQNRSYHSQQENGIRDRMLEDLYEIGVHTNICLRGYKEDHHPR